MSTWPSKRIADACWIKPPKSEVRERLSADSDVTFFPMEDLGIGIKFPKPNKCRRFADVEGAYTYFAERDVLLAKITPCFENGKLGIASGLINGVGFGSSEYIVLRPKPGLTSEWLYYFLSRDVFRDEGAQRMYGAVGHKRVAKEFVEECSLPIPSTKEQQRIVGILDEAFDSIAAAKANAERNVENADATFICILNQIFDNNDRQWDEQPLSDFCDVKHGYAFDGAEFFSGVADVRPIVITPGNFTEDAKLLFSTKNTKRLIVDPPSGWQFTVGDLVVVMTDLSSKMKILGKPAFVERNDVLHNQRIGRVIFLNDALKKRWVYYFMQTQRYLSRIKETATGTMVRHTAPARILSNLVPVPATRGEQTVIIDRLDQLREQSRVLQSVYTRKLAALDELKKSLLHKAFAGEL